MSGEIMFQAAVDEKDARIFDKIADEENRSRAGHLKFLIEKEIHEYLERKIK